MVRPVNLRFAQGLSNRTREWLALGVVAVALLLPLVGLWRYQGPPMEEGFMLAFPEQLLEGRVPHRDFLHLYGPGSLWLLAAVYEVFGATIGVERTVGFLQHAALAYGMYFLVRPFGRRVATLSAVVSVVVLIGPLGLSAMAWNGALALAVGSLAAGSAATVASGRRRRVLAVVSGVMAGASLLFRPDLVVAVALGSIVLVLGMTPDLRRRFVVAGGLTTALYVPHLLVSGVSESFRGMFIEPVFHLRPGRTLPVPPSWGSIDGFLQRAGGLRTTGWPLPMLDLSQQIHLWFWLVPLSILVLLVAGFRLRRAEPGTHRSTSLWAGALFGAALITQAVQRPDTAHLAWVTGITFALLVPAICVLIELGRPRWRPGLRFPIAAGVIAVILVGVVPFYPLRTYVDLVGQSFGQNRFGHRIERDGRVFYFGSSEGADAAQQVVDTLDGLLEPGERLIVGPRDLSRANYSDAFFYHLFPDLQPGTRYIEMDPGIADAVDSGLAEELEENDWLILSDAWSSWDEPNTSSESRSQGPNEVVAERYCEVDDAGMFTLLRRCR